MGARLLLRKTHQERNYFSKLGDCTTVPPDENAAVVSMGEDSRGQRHCEPYQSAPSHPHGPLATSWIRVPVFSPFSRLETGRLRRNPWPCHWQGHMYNTHGTLMPHRTELIHFMNKISFISMFSSRIQNNTNSVYLNLTKVKVMDTMQINNPSAMTHTICISVCLKVRSTPLETSAYTRTQRAANLKLCCTAKRKRSHKPFFVWMHHKQRKVRNILRKRSSFMNLPNNFFHRATAPSCRTPTSYGWCKYLASMQDRSFNTASILSSSKHFLLLSLSSPAGLGWVRTLFSWYNYSNSDQENWTKNFKGWKQQLQPSPRAALTSWNKCWQGNGW